MNQIGFGAAVPPDKNYAQLVDGDDVIHIFGYRTSASKTVLTWILTILTFGLFRLLLHWCPNLLMWCTSSSCSLHVADYVFVRDSHMNVTSRPIHVLRSGDGDYIAVPIGGFRITNVHMLRYFTYKKLKYIWYAEEMRFIEISSFDDEVDFTFFHSLVECGFSSTDVLKRRKIYGKNFIQIKPKPLFLLLFREVLTPFYLFQIFSVTVWFMDDYEIYASVIVIMSMVSIALDMYQTRKQEKGLMNMVHTSGIVEVVRNGGRMEQVGSDELVPGDVILIPSHGCKMHCDAVLMNGTAIVNESMLTGESVPVTKVALPEVDDECINLFTIKEHSRHTLFCGTQVLQTRYYSGKRVKAIVLRTAYSTLKGQLVRSIMYPKPVDFRFTKDLFKFVGFLACIATIGSIYTLVVMIYRGSYLRPIIIRSLDIVTIVIPPALPAAMSIGILAAQIRLRKKQIFCISPSTINTCGAINTVCFDKTGTLTEDGLDFHCLRPVNRFGIKPYFEGEIDTFNSIKLIQYGELIKAISCCHSLTRIHDKLCGDPLDIILFKNTGWYLDENICSKIDETDRFDLLQPTVIRSSSDHTSFFGEIELSIIRQFTFSSSLQRMSVIVHNPKEESRSMSIYCKGSPEIIASLCRRNTIPENYTNVINEYAQHGYRLIAIAYKELCISFAKSQRVKRESVECDLELLGIIIMENRLKPQTIGVINQLNKARIRTIMVTGDNVLTAMSVARECGIIQPRKRTFLVELLHDGAGDGSKKLVLKPSVSSSESVVDDNLSYDDLELGYLVSSSYQLAVTGPVFSLICHEYPEYVDKLVAVCDVFARMSPDQKQLLVNRLQEIDLTVAMCGDGANDCSALKAAHAGISLSEAEASIAAPFTSSVPDIRCVPMIIREGRAALVTSFGVFKYMAGYSLTQFITIIHLYWISTNLTDFQFLYIDLFLVTLIALFFGNTPACEKLHINPPPTKLLSLGSVLSIIGQLLIVFFFQSFVFVFTALQPWFNVYISKFDDTPEDKRSMQGTAVFCVSMFQYITLAVVYSKGLPYRKTIFSNWPLLTSLVVLAAVSTLICLYPPFFIISIMELDAIPEFGYRLFLLIIAVISAVCSYQFEVFFIDHVILNIREKWKKKRNLNVGSSKSNRFEKILRDIGSEPSWILPISCDHSSSSTLIFSEISNNSDG